MGISTMFLCLIPDLRRLNRWSAVSFRYAAAPIWSLKKHPVLTATPVVAASQLQTHARMSLFSHRFNRDGAPQRLPTYFQYRRNFQTLPVFLYNPAANRKSLRYRSGSFPRVDSSSAIFKSSLNLRHPYDQIPILRMAKPAPGSCERSRFGKVNREGAGSRGRRFPALAGTQCFAGQSAGIRGASEGLRGTPRNPNATPQMAQQFRGLKRREVILQRDLPDLSSQFLGPLE